MEASVPATTRDWIRGARPKTLATAIAPVAVGSASASALGSFRPGIAAFALGVALALQVAVNYANDYSDGVRGTDVNRIGPERLVASGKVAPSRVKAAAFAAFTVGSLLGLAMTLVSQQWWLLAVGAAAVLAAWTYTGSSRPYGYRGWGEVSVFVFFGLVATLGTMASQAERVTWWAVVAAAGVGLYAVAMLLVNNIRDLETDRSTGKRTLAVHLGGPAARRLFAASVTLPVVASAVIAIARPWALLALVLAAPAMILAIAIRAGLAGRPMAAAFAGTSAIGLAYGFLLALGIAIS
jgi:1,4-dihydroxy-2-naphthoate octaprenyltransferase